MNFEEIAKAVIKYVGGKENITDVMSCWTRLRLTVADPSLADVEAIKKVEGVKGVNLFNGTYQIVFGEKVTDIAKACQKLMESNESLDSVSEVKKPVEKVKRSFVSVAFDYVANSVQPLITVIIGCGIVQGLVTAFRLWGWIDTSTFTYTMFNTAGKAGYYILPVLLGFTTAKKLGVNPYVGATIGGCLIYPDLLNKIKAEDQILFGIKAAAVDYSSSMTPILLTMPITMLIEKYVKKFSPQILASILVPGLTILFTLPILLIVTGPIGYQISKAIEVAIEFMHAKVPVLAGAVIGATAPYFVLTGVHQATVTPIVTAELASKGYSLIRPLTSYANLATAGCALGVALKTKNKAFRNEALSATFIGAIGIAEPSLYGVMLPTKKPFKVLWVMPAICGVLSLLFGVQNYGMGLNGLAAIPMYIGPTFGIWLALLALAYFGSAALVYFFGIDDIPEEEINE